MILMPTYLWVTDIKIVCNALHEYSILYTLRGGRCASRTNSIRPSALAHVQEETRCIDLMTDAALLTFSCTCRS
jgi:hypothetical protein